MRSHSAESDSHLKNVVLSHKTITLLLIPFSLLHVKVMKGGYPRLEDLGEIKKKWNYENKQKIELLNREKNKELRTGTYM